MLFTVSVTFVISFISCCHLFVNLFPIFFFFILSPLTDNTQVLFFIFLMIIYGVCFPFSDSMSLYLVYRTYLLCCSSSNYDCRVFIARGKWSFIVWPYDKPRAQIPLLFLSLLSFVFYKRQVSIRFKTPRNRPKFSSHLLHVMLLLLPLSVPFYLYFHFYNQTCYSMITFSIWLFCLFLNSYWTKYCIVRGKITRSITWF